MPRGPDLTTWGPLGDQKRLQGPRGPREGSRGKPHLQSSMLSDKRMAVLQELADVGLSAWGRSLSAEVGSTLSHLSARGRREGDHPKGLMPFGQEGFLTCL